MVDPQTFINYVISECKPPTYLKHFVQEDGRIVLAHLVKPRKESYDEEDAFIISESIVKNTSPTADLTGNPLELDLQQAEQYLDVTIINNNPNSWLKSEVLHIPVPLTNAIRFITRYRENNVNIGDHLNMKIYCVCDGLDMSKTVLTGVQTTANSFDTYELNFKGCHAKTDSAIDMLAMKKEHLKEVGNDAKVSCEIISKYAVKGFDLKLLCNPNDSNLYGSLLLDVFWKDSIGFNVGTSNISSSKLHIQAVAGHRNSPISVLWDDLLLVDKFINLLESPLCDLEEMMLSERHFTYHDIIKQMEDTLQSFSPFRKMHLENKVEITNFEDFRHYNGIDSFWNILKRSKQVDDVRGVFHYIFTEAARDKSLHINIPLNNNGFFANMLSGILDGTHAVPTFTHVKALECLIEFGIAKLKNDYLYILDTYNCDTQSPAFEIFNVMCDDVPDKRRTVNRRRTVRFQNDNRLTINRHRRTIFDLNTSEVDIGLYNKQLHVLSGLHMSIQSIILLTEQFDVTSDAFYHAPQYIMDHFLGPNRSVNSFKELLQNNLCELSLDITDIDKNILNKFEILHWNYCFKSINYKTIITSIYLHSLDPIFPPCVIKNYDYPDDTEEDVYYVCRYLSIKDSF